MLTQIYHKKNEKFEVEFFEDVECTKAFDFTNDITSYFKCNVNTNNYGDPNNFYRYKPSYYIQLKDGDISPLIPLPMYTLLYCPYIPQEIYNKIKDIILYENDISLRTLNEITPNYSKYIPKDSAVLFLNEENAKQYKISNAFTIQNNNIPILYNGIVLTCIPPVYDTYKKVTIFTPELTSKNIQQINDIAKDLKDKYNVADVNVFAVHCFIKTNHYDMYLDWHRNSGEFSNIVELITTNSTGILKPQDTERLKVIDCKEIFEEWLKNNC